MGPGPRRGRCYRRPSLGTSRLSRTGRTAAKQGDAHQELAWFTSRPPAAFGAAGGQLLGLLALASARTRLLGPSDTRVVPKRLAS